VVKGELTPGSEISIKIEMLISLAPFPYLRNTS